MSLTQPGTANEEPAGEPPVRELVEISRRADNAALLDALPDLDIETASVVAAVEDARAKR